MMVSWAIAVQLGLVVVLILISVAGNATIGALLVRFKKLRTIPNILISNMAVIDLLNSVINMPLTCVIHILRWERNKISKSRAFAVGSIYALFFNLNFFSMILIAADRYGAIVHGMKYMLWKTQRKAFVGVGLVWSLSFVFTAVNYIPFLELEIPNGTVIDYRKAQFEKTGRITALVKIPLVVLLLGILSALTWRTIARARAKLPGIQDLSAQVRQKREMNDLKATKTLMTTFLVFFICYLPTVICSVYVTKGYEIDKVWFGFVAIFCPFLSSGCNPMIYALRTKRFRHATRQLWEDPCGKRPLQEAEKVEGGTPLQEMKVNK